MSKLKGLAVGTAPSHLPSSAFAEELQAQRAYCREAAKRLQGLPLIDAEALIDGMRDSGYKSTGNALNELFDNAIQAKATQVDVIVHFPGEQAPKKRLTSGAGGVIAVVDNGHGMDPTMIQVSVMWGGTHRRDSRAGMGRYGFGLPTAAVSMCRRFKVYSRVPGGAWHAVVVDLDAIASGGYRTKDGMVAAPTARPEALPEFVRVELPGGDLLHGTVVVLENLDRLTTGYSSTESFRKNMLQEVGLTYRNFMKDVTFRVINGETTVVEPIDPLFLTPGARFYSEHPSLAKALPEQLLTVSGKDGKPGTVRIRFALMEPEFMDQGSQRFRVRKANNGIIVLRKGRQIDVVSGSHYWLPNDRYVGVELDFDPVLDEDFSVTTNKQHIRISDRMWGELKKAGLLTALAQLRADYKRLRAEAEEPKRKAGPCVSEEVAAATERFRHAKPKSVSPAWQREHQESLEQEVAARVKETGKTEAQVLAEITAKHYDLQFESNVEGPIYRVVQLGGQRRLYLNMAHRFYTDVYLQVRPSDRMRAALELLLFTLGDCELKATDEKARFYKSERSDWSRYYEVMLEDLDRRNPMAESSAADEAIA